MTPSCGSGVSLRALVRRREEARCSAGELRARVVAERNGALDLSASRVFNTDAAFYGKGVSVTDLDPLESRYLLAGSTDGTVGCFDVLQHYYGDGRSRGARTAGPATRAVTVHEPLFRIAGTPPNLRHDAERVGHKGRVTGLQWYPIDAGLFVSGSEDCTVRLFDANELSLVCTSKHEFEVNCIRMSGVASSHSLVAVATRCPVIKLWDPRNGCISSHLAGHIGKEVAALEWSKTSEWLLISGGADGQIRVWDIRKANSCVFVLDQFNMKKYSEHLAPLPDVDLSHLKRKKLKTPRTDEDRLLEVNGGRGNRFDRNLQDWISSKRLVKKFSDPKRNDVATAHDCPVKVLHCDGSAGLCLYSTGKDGIKKWDLTSGKNMLVHFELPQTAGTRCNRVAATSDGQNQTLFIPHVNNVFRVHAVSGKRLSKLTGGHYEAVTSALYNEVLGELYTSSLDGNVLVWEPPGADPAEAFDQGGFAEAGAAFGNEDEWTTDEEQ